MKICTPLILVAGLAPAAAPALTLDFPVPAEQTARLVDEQGQAHLPVSAWVRGDFRQRTVEGRISRQAWRLPAQSLTTMQIYAPLRDQLMRDGFKTVFECSDRACGGFDFRFAADVLNEPAMHVDLGDFRYLMAENPDGVAVALLVSRAPGAGFVQLTRAGDGSDSALEMVTSTKSLAPPSPLQNSDPLTGLADTGHAPLDDLLFQTGSAELRRDKYPSLLALSAFLDANPDQSVTLVGHTDAEGSLNGNIGLSRRRAEAVMRSLVADYGVAPSRVRAEGVGFLAPRASNATEDGRLANRRVEVILTN